jgi:serine protease AprX
MRNMIGDRLRRLSSFVFEVFFFATLLLSLVPFASGGSFAEAGSGRDWRVKVDEAVLDKACLNGAGAAQVERGATDYGQIEFMVFLSEQADLSPAAELKSKLEKGEFVFETLTEVADRTQPAIAAVLDEEGAEYKRFWAANVMWVRGHSRILEMIAKRADVQHIYDNVKLQIEEPVPVDGPSEEGAGDRSTDQKRAEWNIELVNAPAVWAEGVTGEGAVVGGTDTGYDWTHPAIKNQYRGWNGVTADHNYNWHDAVHDRALNCPPNSPEPCDEEIHGTHTMGIMVGDDGGFNRIGMAPGAKWIGCRCWERVKGTDIAYVTECLQWMIAPTDLNDLNPDPSKAPDVVNNSWVCAPFEGCSDLNVLKAVIQNMREAGIVPLGGVGNDGPQCSSAVYPPAIYNNYFSVGATTIDDLIAQFSSRGPIAVDESHRTKPDISAPGQGVRSCAPGDTYIYWSGTSFAGPHVAGLVALLVSANPNLAGDVDLIEDIIKQTAVRKTTTQQCGDVLGTEIPNNTFGHGRIDAYAAYKMAMSLVPEEPKIYEFALKPNFPNPFGSETSITYSLARRSDVRLCIYDAAGRLVRDLVDARVQQPSEYTVSWDGTSDSGDRVASGVYFCRIWTGQGERTQRMILVR